MPGPDRTERDRRPVLGDFFDPDAPISSNNPDYLSAAAGYLASPSELAYTLISNKAYKHVRSMFTDEKPGDRRDYQNDTQAVVRRLEGSYPNFFYVVELEGVEAFVSPYNNIKNRDDHEQFVARCGLRRTNPDFWAVSDWFNEKYARYEPIQSGLFDLNRYENR